MEMLWFVAFVMLSFPKLFCDVLKLRHSTLCAWPCTRTQPPPMSETTTEEIQIEITKLKAIKEAATKSRAKKCAKTKAQNKENKKRKRENGKEGMENQNQKVFMSMRLTLK